MSELISLGQAYLDAAYGPTGNAERAAEAIANRRWAVWRSGAQFVAALAFPALPVAMVQFDGLGGIPRCRSLLEVFEMRAYRTKGAA